MKITRRDKIGIVIGFIVAMLVLAMTVMLMLESLFQNTLNENNFLVFSNHPTFGEDALFLTETEMRKFVSQYDNYKVDTYYANLNDSEKTIYKSFEFAFENSYTNILIDETILKDTERSLSDILEFYSLDSPLIEQNITLTSKEFPIEAIGKLKTHKTVKGTYVSIERFSEDRFSLKEEALTEALDIISNMPRNLNEFEKCKYFFEYMQENVTYKACDSHDDANYLYDALCKKESQCDGFSNAFSLLCNASGIKCFEKISFSADGGHAWNVVEINNTYYNVDSSSQGSVLAIQYNGGFVERFCFSDEMQINLPRWTDIIPACEKCINSVDFIFDNETEIIIENICDDLQSNEKTYFSIAIKHSKLSESIMQEIVDTCGISFTITGSEGMNCNIYYFCKK